MGQGKHMAWMLAAVAVGAVLLSTGVGGGLVLLLWTLACLAMMGLMMWGMSRAGKPEERPVSPSASLESADRSQQLSSRQPGAASTGSDRAGATT